MSLTAKKNTLSDSTDTHFLYTVLLCFQSIFRTVKDLITPKWLFRLFTSDKQHEPKEPQEEDTRTTVFINFVRH